MTGKGNSFANGGSYSNGPYSPGCWHSGWQAPKPPDCWDYMEPPPEAAP
jgi:hypothetical protein